MLAATLPAACAKCGHIVEAWMPWDVGHRIPTIIDPDSMDDPDSWQVEHSWCNRREGQWLSAQRRRRGPISPTSRDW